MERERKVPTGDELEKQIRREMVLVRKKKPTREQMQAELRKYDSMYRACVMDGGTTLGPYIWREVYRRLLDETK